jgi:hypothetical protein
MEGKMGKLGTIYVLYTAYLGCGASEIGLNKFFYFPNYGTKGAGSNGTASAFIKR